MENRSAFGVLEVRAIDDEKRIIEGVANSSSVDSYGTVIEPDGAVYRLPIPLFFHENGRHSHAKPIGNVVETWVRDGLRWVRAHIPKIQDDGTEGGRAVKFRVDSAWADIKAGTVRGLSIEFLPIEPRSATAKRWTKWSWHGLTVVPVPSNMDATIEVVRSIASSGSQPDVSGDNTPTSPRRKMTIQEQITQNENSRAAKVARQQALMERSGTEGTTLNEQEAQEYDQLTTEVAAIDAHLARLAVLKRANDNAARPAQGGSSTAANESRNQPTNIQVRTLEKPGHGFARYVMSLIAAGGNRAEAAEYARSVWGDQGEGVALMHRAAMLGERAAVAAGTTTNATFAAPLVQTNYVNEFLELLRPKTVIGRINNIRRVPFYTQMTVQTAGGTYSWVGQSVPKPVTNLQVAAVSLAIAKAAGIIVISEELARNSTPDAQQVVTDEMIAGMQQYLDTQFVDPAVAAVANVSPASITNGVTGTAASGTTEADARADLRLLISNFAASNLDLGGLVILMGETLAFKLGTMVNAVGAPAFPGLGINGGSILGIPVVTSNVTPLQTRMVAVHAPSVMLADQGGTEISISREATIIMDSAPAAVTQTAGQPPIHTSLWQNNLVGIRSERWINWGKARSTAVDMIHTIAYE